MILPELLAPRVFLHQPEEGSGGFRELLVLMYAKGALKVCW